jgi:hypothetical protein
MPVCNLNYFGNESRLTFTHEQTCTRTVPYTVQSSLHLFLTVSTLFKSNNAETLDDKSRVVTLIDSSGASQLCSVTGGKYIVVKQLRQKLIIVVQL